MAYECLCKSMEEAVKHLIEHTEVKIGDYRERQGREMTNIEVFQEESDDELCYIYKQILKGRDDGLRPRCLDKYIEKVRKVYSTLSFAEAWRHTEKLFWDEIGKRYFENKK